MKSKYNVDYVALERGPSMRDWEGEKEKKGMEWGQIICKKYSKQQPEWWVIYRIF